VATDYIGLNPIDLVVLEDVLPEITRSGKVHAILKWALSNAPSDAVPKAFATGRRRIRGKPGAK
jgi:hypothetical protein